MFTIIYRDKKWELKDGMTVRDAILKVGLDVEAVLAVRDGQLINEETLTRDGDVIKLVAVISGGEDVKLTTQQWIGVIAGLVILNLIVFGGLFWLMAADLESMLSGSVEVELPASPTMVAQAAPTLRPTFTPTPGVAQPPPTKTPVPLSTPVPTDTATVTDTPASTLLPADNLTPMETVAPTGTPTLTPIHTPTDTLTPVPTDTPTPTNTLTPTRTHTPLASPTAMSTATPPPGPTVAPVAVVKVLSASDDRIDLSWKPAPGSESLTYHIYWDMGLGLRLYTYKTSVEGTRYSDLNLRPGTSYRYRIVAYDGSRESPVCEVLATTRVRPTLIAMATSEPTQTPQPATSQRPTATPTPTASPSPTPTSTASPTSMPSQTPTPSPIQRPTTIPASTPTSQASPTPRRIVATPTPLPPDTVLLGLMSSHDYEDDLGFITIVGEVRNDLQMNVGKVLVTATFYSASGDVIEEVSTSTMLDILLPGQRSPFALILPRPVDLWEYSLRITARPTLEQPLAGLEVVQSHADEDEAGFYHVTGEVENTGQRTADRIQVIITLYDKWGKIVNAGFAYTEPRRVRPEEKAAFDCSFTYYPLVKEHAIQVERD